MIYTIRVRTISGPDLAGKSILHDIRHLLGITHIKNVESSKIYRIEGIDIKDAEILAKKLFCESINQNYTINKPILTDPKHTIEIAYKPGVMNPEVSSILKAAHNLGIQPIAADSSHEYGFFGNITHAEIKKIVKQLRLLNETIEHIVTKEPETLIIAGKPGKTNIIPIRKLKNDELMELSKDKLFLNLDEMQVIQQYFQKLKRDPTDCELETIAQTWSEHCAHKTFKANLIVDGKKKTPLFSRLKKEALKHNKHIVSAFVDNAGVMDFYDGWAINGKAETHNAPSAIEPYGGAMTGSGGVFRDIVATGLGAKTVVSTDIFCLAPPDMDKKKLPEGTLPPDYILKRVVAAVRDYGNRMGIPTNNGSFHFHEDFRAKPVVLVGAYGILPKNKAQIGKPQKGDVIVAIGGRTGRDGIHGATFSSGEMTERTMEVHTSAVQIGNAIEEKRMFDVVLEARDQDLIRAIQDCGAGGFSSAIGEMGAHVGATVHLEKALLKYQGLTPWEIWLSESQERMIIAIDKDNISKLLKICKKYNVEASILGEFDGSKKLNVFYGKEQICNLNMNFLHNGLPQRTMTAKYIEKGAADGTFADDRKLTGKVNRAAKKKVLQVPKTEKEWISLFKKIVSHGNINSKEPIVRMYDHTVQGTNALSPFTGIDMNGPNDAVVIRPFLQKPYGMIVSHGLNPILNKIDPYWGSIWAATEAIANYAAVGGNYKEASLINNYIWPFPDEEWLWKLDRSVDAVVDFMKALQIPVISGKDSLSATYKGKNGFVLHNPPTLCISVFGKISDVTKTVSSDFKKIGTTIVFIGKMDAMAMGKSVYYDVSRSSADHDDKIPHIDLKILPKVLNVLYQSIQQGMVLSCHDVSEGGLLTTIFEMCVGGNLGANINANHSIPPDYFLFNETSGCFIVEVKDEKTAQALFKGIPYTILGKTQKQETINVENLFKIDILQLKESWSHPMKEIFS